MRDQDNIFAPETVGDMTRRERERDDRQGRGEPDEPERGGGMRARIHFPLDRDGEHLPPNDGDKIA